MRPNRKQQSLPVLPVFSCNYAENEIKILSGVVEPGPAILACVIFGDNSVQDHPLRRFSCELAAC